MDDAGLEALTTEQLRQKAFEQARDAHDVSFFWDLVKHLRSTRNLASGDVSSGGLTGGLAEAVEVARELMGKDLGDDEPLLRARFLDYLNNS